MVAEAFNLEDIQTTRLARRLEYSTSATSLPASIRFDLAAGDLNDDDYEEAIDAFSETPRATSTGAGSGWGFSAVLDDLMRREPRSVPVGDIQQTQQFLAEQGYVHDDTPIDGLWSSDWNSAFQRAERDAYEKRIEGHHALSTPTESIFRFLGGVMPSAVWQGVVGGAKGMVQQAPETAENLGAVGGAATGAALGSIVAPGIGTAIGAAAGGVIGFFSDLFGDDETEGADRSGWAQFFDALTPWEEYKKGGLQKFSEDLGFVLTAASLLRGGAMALGGVRAGGAAIRAGATQGGSLASRLGLSAPMRAKPGYITRIMASPKGAAAVGGVGGAAVAHSQDENPIVGAILGASVGYGVGRAFGSQITNTGRRFGLQRVYDMPLVKSVNETFTGFSTASMGARYGGGLLSGAKETEIEAAIKGAPALPGGDLLDATLGWVLVPQRFFPLTGFEMGKAAERVLGAEHMMPYDLLAREIDTATGKVLGAAARDEKVRTWLGEGDPTNIGKILANDLRLRLNYGRERELATMDFANLKGDELIEARLRARSEMTLEFQNEMAAMAKGEASDMPVTRRWMEWSEGTGLDAPEKGPLHFYQWLKGQGGHGTSLDRMGMQVTAERVGEDAMDYAARGDIKLGFGDDIPVDETTVQILGGKEFQRVMPRRAKELQNEAAKNEEKAMKIRMSTKVSSDDLAEADRLMDEAMGLKKEASTIKAVKLQGSLVPANKADPVTGIVETPTAQDARSFATRWRTALDQVIGAAERRTMEGMTPEGILQANQEIEQGLETLRHVPATKGEAPGLLQTLYHSGLIDQDQLIKTYNALDEFSKTGRVRKRDLGIDGRLNKLAEKGLLPHEVVLTPELAARMPEGKKMVWMSQPVIRTSDIPKRFAEENADLFAERPFLWDTIRSGTYSNLSKASKNSLKNLLRNVGASPVLHSGEEIFHARAANQASELHGILNKYGIEMTGDQAMRRLQRQQEIVNHGHGNIIRRADEPKQEVIAERARLTRQLKDDTGTALGHPEKRLYVADTRELKLEDIKDALDLDMLGPSNVSGDQVAYEAMKALKKGAALGAETNMAHPIQAAKMLGKSMQIDGLPGFLEFMRTFDVDRPRTFFGLGGAAAGALAAEGGLGEHLKGAAIGGAIGIGALGAIGKKSGIPFKTMLKAKYPQGSFGFLPDHLHRLSMATRYTFSLMFDAGRYLEQANIGLLKEDIPMFFNARKYIQRTYGDSAWDDALRLHDEMTGKRTMEYIEEADRRMFQTGILGYSPRYSEAARAFILKKRNPNISMGELKRRVSQLEGYGTGRRTIEKSVNFLFFPFSFQKKLITTLGDFVLQEPARALLIHEGFRRFNESEVGKDVGAFTERYLPIAQQLQRLNNLSYGVGPGRFFLQGLLDDPKGRRTDLGLAAEILSTVGVPSAANVPLAQMFGGAGDAMVHMFMPTVITDDNEQGLGELVGALDTFIPALRDINTLFSGALPGVGSAEEPGVVARQFIAATKGGDPYWQQQNFIDERRMKKAELEETARALGYASADGLLASDVGQLTGIAARYDQEMAKLQEDYPVGAQMSETFTNSTGMKERALLRLHDSNDRTEGEDAILRIAQMEQEGRNLAAMMGQSQDSLLGVILPRIRAEAMLHAEDPDFVYLYERLYARDYGPITSTLEMA